MLKLSKRKIIFMLFCWLFQKENTGKVFFMAKEKEMEEFEIKYCEKVNKILNKKLNDIRKKINELSQRFAEMRKDLDINYSDYIRGGDMAERRSSMENIEELENDYEQERKRLNLQNQSR